MTTTNDYIFNNLGRIGADTVDNTQRNLANSRYANYMLNDQFSALNSTTHINFATQQPSINFRGTGGGAGVPGIAIDYDSMLTIKTDQERSFERLQLNQRPFMTIPYLGRGSVNPVLESQMLIGEYIGEKKSDKTIMDKSFINYSDYPLMDDVKERITNPAYSVEEAALNGWTRGGASSRDMANDRAISTNR
jgi:hypothetical protein